MKNIKVLTVFLLTTISCNGIFEQEEIVKIIYNLENTSSNKIEIIRYGNQPDTIVLFSNATHQEQGESKIGGEGFNYPLRFDSLDVIYNDTIYITHYPYDIPFYYLEKPICDQFEWETTKTEKPESWLTKVFMKYDFTNQDFEEAKLKGKKVQ